MFWSVYWPATELFPPMARGASVSGLDRSLEAICTITLSTVSTSPLTTGLHCLPWQKTSPKYITVHWGYTNKNQMILSATNKCVVPSAPFNTFYHVWILWVLDIFSQSNRWTAEKVCRFIWTYLWMNEWTDRIFISFQSSIYPLNVPHHFLSIRWQLWPHPRSEVATKTRREE